MSGKMLLAFLAVCAVVAISQAKSLNDEELLEKLLNLLSKEAQCQDDSECQSEMAALLQNDGLGAVNAKCAEFGFGQNRCKKSCGNC